MTDEEITCAVRAFEEGARAEGLASFEILTPTDAAFVAFNFRNMGSIGVQLLKDSTPEKRAAALKRWRVPVPQGRSMP